MNIRHHGGALVIHIARTAVVDGQFFVYGDLGIGRAAGVYGTNVDRQVESPDVAGAAQIELRVDSGAADGRVRTSALVEIEVGCLNAALEVTGAGKVYAQIGGL